MSNLNLKKQMPKNLGMNLLSFLINVFVGLWIVPYLIEHIGLAAYGLVPLAMVFSQYVGIIVQALNSSVNRFLLIALQKRNSLEANRVFNTSIMMILVLVVIQSIIMAGILLNLSGVITIPEGLSDDAFWLFALTFMGLSISLFRAVITTHLFSSNRLDLLRLIDIVQILARLSIVVLLFTYDEPQLRYVGIANFLASVITLGMAFYYKRRLAPNLHIDLTMVDVSQIKNMLTMSGWVFASQVGFLLFVKVDIYIANKFIGVAKAGEYAAVIQWNNLLRAMAAVFSGILTPVIMIYFARDEIDKLIALLKTGVKLMGITMAIPIAIVSALSAEILGIWLGVEFQYLDSLMLLSLVPLVIHLTALPLFSVNISFNRVKVPGLVSILLGLANVGLSLYLVLNMELGLYGLVIASAIVLTFRNAVFIPVYAAHVLGINKRTFFVSQAIGVVFFSAIFFITKLLAMIMLPDSILSLLAVVSVSGIVCVSGLLGYLKISKEMRPLMNSLLRK